MHDENIHLRSVLRAGAAELPSAEDDLELPLPGARQYAAHSRPSNKPLYSIHFLSPAGVVHSFQYVHLDSNSSYTAECVTLRFVGIEPVKVAIHGRNLWRLYDYIHQHRISWVMQAPRDFAQDGHAVITMIVFDNPAIDRQ